MILSNRLTVGRYLPIETMLHNLDARTKILCSILVILSLFMAASWHGWVVATVGIAIVSLLAGISLTYLSGNFRPLFPILVLTFFLNGWMTIGTPVHEQIPFTYEGLLRGSILCIRLILIVTVTGLLSLTTTPLELADGLHSLLSPLAKLRIPIHELALTATIALRLIPLLGDEATRIRNAQLSRGGSSRGSLARRVTDAAGLLIPLFVAAFGRAERLADSMEARGYRGAVGRTRFREPVFSKRDVAAFVLSLLFGFGVNLLDFV